MLPFESDEKVGDLEPTGSVRRREGKKKKIKTAYLIHEWAQSYK